MIKSTDISKAIELEVKRTSELQGKPPVSTKYIEIDALPPRPVATIESDVPVIIETETPGSGKSYVDFNFGASAVNTETVTENENRKKFIQYGAILFIVLFLMLMVMSLKKNK